MMQRKLQSKLVLISGTGDSPKLAEDIYRELRDTYQMGDSVSRLIPQRPEEVDKDMIKGHVYPLVIGRFSDGETRVDIGKSLLFNEIRGKHVVIIKYMYTPKRNPHMHVNDHLSEVVGLLDVIKNTDILRSTLVAPYLPYLRSHSIEKYAKKGFYQYDSLTDMIESLNRKGLEGIICIDPHSEKIIEKGREFGITINSIDPFHSNRYINPYKLGLNSTAEDTLSKLQPFLEYFNKLKDNFKDKKIVLLSLDDNAEKRTEQFLINNNFDWNHMIYFKKVRNTTEKPTFLIKNFSRVNENSFDENVICIIPDDMVDSGGSADGVAGLLKEKGVKHIEVWCTHPVISERRKIENMKNIDKIVTLDTILHENPGGMRTEYLNVSSHLLTAEIFKAHMKLEEERLSA